MACTRRGNGFIAEHKMTRASNSIDVLHPENAVAYEKCATQNVLAALNPKIFFGYFSVCADGVGHGGNTTFPGLDWGQSAEALLWLGRDKEVLASWEYVKSFQREDGLLPFAILPDIAGKTIQMPGGNTLTAATNGAVFEHWVPGNPLRTLANVTTILMAEAIHRHTGDAKWLARQAGMLARTASWLICQVTTEGLVQGGGFYLERPTRIEYDGVNQCYTMHALRLAAQMLGDPRSQVVADSITQCFRRQFWAGDHCVEYIHPQRGAISHHGLTDVDWAAIATGILTTEQEAVLWPQLKNERRFYYGGMPSGIATRPESYEDWEFTYSDRLDLAAMGRVWFLESWARARMGDRDGILESVRRVCERGRADGYYWRERYTPDGQGAGAQKYCEYPANLIRIRHRFLSDAPPIL